MAEIDVERRGERNVWPWVIGALALILLAAALVSLMGSDEPDVEVRQAVPESAPATGG